MVLLLSGGVLFAVVTLCLLWPLRDRADAHTADDFFPAGEPSAPTTEELAGAGSAAGAVAGMDSSYSMDAIARMSSQHITVQEKRAQVLEALSELAVSYHGGKLSAADYQAEQQRLQTAFAKLEDEGT